MKCRKSYKDQEKYRLYHNNYMRKYYDKTAVYRPHRYTDEEDELILKHNMTDTELSDLIGHSVKSIQIRRSRLKKKIENSNNR